MRWCVLGGLEEAAADAEREVFGELNCGPPGVSAVDINSRHPFSFHLSGDFFHRCDLPPQIVGDALDFCWRYRAFPFLPLTFHGQFPPWSSFRPLALFVVPVIDIVNLMIILSIEK